MCSKSRTTAIIIPSSCKLSEKADTGQSFQRTPMPKLVSFTQKRYIFTRKHCQNKPIACGEALNVDMIHTHNLAFHISFSISILLGFLYTLVVRRPSGSLETAVSRKASLLLFSVSMVKRMEGCWLFRCCKKSSTFPRSRIVKVSST